ncbi:ATP-binding cassette domain-containing protein [Anabaena minutissima FACHB-250]|nr:ATP-binding cassette domain-containing protein [Anabaena minutissima FACHB-250]
MTIINKQEITAKPQEKESDIVLCVKGVSKKFCRDLKQSLMYGVQDITSELLGLREKSDQLRKKEFWALNNVSFELRRGEALGLVGKNGSGKSTLLRIIAGLIKPDSGCVEVNGRVAPLIALGAGFNPILTGRENIYANMAILGLSKKEIDERFDEVIKFAEIGDAIDAPVQTYSSGMAARLGFASAIHTEPDILLIDEVLAVGDAKFQSKCYQKLNELRQNGSSFILVSHSSHSIATVCDRAIYLQKGEKVLSGDVTPVLNKYEYDLFQLKSQESLGFIVNPEKTNTESTSLDINLIFFRDKKNKFITSPTSGELVYLVIDFIVSKTLSQVSLSIKARKFPPDSTYLMYINSQDDNNVFPSILPGRYELQIKMPYFGLGVGVYDFKIEIYMQKISLLYTIESFKFEVNVNPIQSCQSRFFQPHSWKISKK